MPKSGILRLLICVTYKIIKDFVVHACPQVSRNPQHTVQYRRSRCVADDLPSVTQLLSTIHRPPSTTECPASAALGGTYRPRQAVHYDAG